MKYDLNIKKKYIVEVEKYNNSNIKSTYLKKETIDKINRNASVRIQRNEMHRSSNMEIAAKTFSR